MRRCSLPFFLCLGLAAAVPAAASDVADGKTRLALPPGYELSALGVAAVLAPAFDLKPRRVEPDYRIEPVSALGNLEDSLRFNLERLDVTGYADYNTDRFLDQSGSIIWDIVGAYGLTTALGLSSWDWELNTFRFESEGWFGDDTKYGGMDKLGHAYSGYLLTEYFTQRIAHSAEDRSGAAISGAILGMGVQTYVEVFDGFSGGHGFSYEDLIMDGIGVGFSMLRSTVPGLAEKLDFRMEYLPSGYAGSYSPATDYSGQKYLLALKLSGFEELEQTPLRFVELQVGYFARGFSDDERKEGADRQREPYVAIGLNLNELLGASPVKDTTAGLIAQRATEYFQVPYTYIPTHSD
jgi:hypothetical protein